MGGRPGLVVETVAASDSALIEQLVAMGDTAASTLGMLRPAVYDDAARSGYLLVARDAGKVVGYTLYRCPRSEVVVTHVCVDAAHRRRGIARHLVEEVSSRHPNRHGLRAKCRNNYELGAFWRSLGFDYLGDTHGRGADEAPMTVWWRDHQIPNLFSPPVDEVAARLLVAIDTNILMDLNTRPDTPQARRSQVLLGPDLVDRMELVVSQGLERDLEGQPEEAKARLVGAAEQYQRPNVDPVRARSLFDTLLATVKLHSPGFGSRSGDEGDLWQVAHAAAAGIKVLATWDDRLRTVIGPIVARIARPEFEALRIIDPDHLVVYLDQLVHAAAYQPRALQGSEFSGEQAGAASEAALLALLNSAAGEARSDLRARVRAAARAGRPPVIIRDAEGIVVAGFATYVDGPRLRVPFLRVNNHEHASTIARRLLWWLREQARDEGTTVVVVEDPHLSRIVRWAAVHESYEVVGERLVAWVIDRCGTSLAVTTAVTAARASLDLGPASLLTPRLPAEVAAQYERTWWPAKLTDSELPHFAVAIQPDWSAGLFGIPATLTERPSLLALGREQVYYRSGKNSGVAAPGRILWFLSQDRTARRPRTPGEARTSSFIGTSLLDAVDTDTPENLHSALQHYGVYPIERIRDAADRRGLAQAFRFSDTEFFPTPVSWKQYEELLEVHGGPRQILAPVRLSTPLFSDIYALGQQRADTTG